MSQQAPISTHASGLSKPEIDALLAHAQRVARNAYSPYSRFSVGAALLLTDGSIVAGCNVENSSYRLTSCAEQGAIAAAVAQHGPQIQIRAVAVANLDPKTACMSCGACRQTILEFATDNCWIFYPGEGGDPQDHPLRELLPASFRLAH